MANGRATKSAKPKLSQGSKQNHEATVGEYLRYLLPGGVSSRVPPNWPPDLFAISSALLQKSGAYHHVIGSWPPEIKRAKGARESRSEWAVRIHNTGVEWRRQLKRGDRLVPADVCKWWRKLCTSQSAAFHNIATDIELCAALVQMMAVSDEACVGFGLPGGEFDPDYDQPQDDAFLNGQRLLLPGGSLSQGSTLCERIDRAKLRVLPKLHTPRAGLTVRSLSQYLSLCTGNEIVPNWYRTPVKHRSDLNILLVPWPEQIQSSQFSAVTDNLPGGYGLFSYRAEPVPNVQKKMSDLIARAQESLRGAPGVTARLDGVVLPELSLTPEDFAAVSKTLSEKVTFVVSGVANPAEEAGQPGHNSVKVDIFPGPQLPSFSLKSQNKHHRWQLESSQIKNYGLDKELIPLKRWWEFTGLENRTINFIPLLDWLTLSVLICEDLARPDPVGDLLRAVGPNLVIALLMDGPQKDWRWSARYATSLADDPGSSVLTLTSAGMVRRYLHKIDNIEPLEIGCWKDVRQGRVQPIVLPARAEAVVLHIEMHLDEEWTADGRGDKRASCYPVLKRAIPIGGGDPIDYPLLK